METKSNEQFTSNADYINEEVEALRIRLQLHDAQTQLRQAEREAETGEVGRHRQFGVRELRGLVHELSHREQEKRDEINSRLETHRANPDNNKLGIDRLCDHFSLDGDERAVILALFFVALSRSLSSELAADGLFCGCTSVDDIVTTVLGAHSVADILRGRARFLPGSRLRQAGVIVEPYQGVAHAGVLPEANVWLSSKAFSFACGISETELPSDDSSDE